MNTGRQSAGNSLAWLGGFIDADGCIGIHKHTTSRNAPTFVPEISVTTTCTITADHISSLFSEMSLPIYRQLRKVTKPNWTDRHHLEVRGMLRVMKLLPLIRPFLVTKAIEADLVMEFILSRKMKPQKHTYSENELKLVCAVSAIKRSRHK